MAGVKISNLPALTTPALSDIYPTVQAGVTYKVTLAQLQDALSDYVICRAATTGALTATYNNGTAGVGATLTNAGALAAFQLDGVTLVAEDVVLIKNQASTFQNGIYSVTTVGDGATAWVLTRITSFDSPGDIEPGDFFTVGEGTTNGKTQWIQTQTVATVGTDAILFESNVVAGANITKTNNSIAAVPSGANTQMQYNNAGAFGADANFTTNGSGSVNITGDLDVDNININGNTISSTDANGNVIVDPNGTGEIQLGASVVTVEQYIQHSGDSNNFIEFGSDTQDYQTNGSSRMDISNSGVRLGAANARVTTILDEDTMVSNSATALATQQSIKAYVDNSIGVVTSLNFLLMGG